MVWKRLTGAPVTVKDLEAIDKGFVENVINWLENPVDVDESNWSEYIFSTFTVKSVANVEIPLMPGGEFVNLTWDNRLDYTKKGLNGRLGVTVINVLLN